jgi:hypothetical protein
VPTNLPPNGLESIGLLQLLEAVWDPFASQTQFQFHVKSTTASKG